ncbi:translocation/assembly module TamB domain-containing protein [Pedobacter sp. MC2016-15]|uniref:translocation/assembly module TamB domain-containing protein n=1 Tax=Pedobacter sp. MC2016-15 TaxID=2994473 RepID=UPI0022486198|nr:translocation/assembly module TamB domain-containing protein [Pedobacter sp. MC2016-15]MCX2480930.1 translocation/assembly module TamB domain-containing protein [Pedobacter sp. MC2016-15]
MNKYVRKSLKVILWVVASIIMLVVLVAVALNIPAVQNFVKDKAISYLKNKTHTEVSLESVKIALPKDVVLNKFYMEDKKGDTLLYAQRLAVDISLMKLLSNKVEINNIELEKIRANVTRINPDTTYNFSFLLDAFMSEQKKPDEEVEKDSTSTMKFSINKVSFKDIGIIYRDDVAGNDVSVRLGEFETNIKDFDMDKQHYVIKNLSLKNTTLKYLQQKPLTQLTAQIEKSLDTATAVAGKLPLVEIQDIDFNNVKLKYDDMLSDTRADLNINELTLTKLFADLTKMDIKLDDATLNKSDILFAFKPAAPVKDAPADTAAAKPSAMAVLVSKLNLAENNIQFDNLGEKPLAKGMDFNHLKIKGLGLAAEDLSYSAAGIKVNVKSGTLKEKSGFEVNKLQGDVVYNDKMVKLSNLVFKTPNTNIENNTELNYTSLEDLTKHPERVKLSLQIKNTTLGLKDATYFSDAVPANYRNEKIKVTANVKGYMSNLSIPQLQITGLKSTRIDVNGTVKGLPDVEKTFLDLNIKRFNMTKADLLVLIPKKSLPANITLPNTIAANGKFKGSMTNFNTGFNINTDMGSAKLLASMKGPKGKESYTADVSLNNFNVGRLIQMQQQLGRITVKANVTGSGLDAKTANAKINGQLISAAYNKYTYRNLLLSGTYAAQKLNLKSSMADSNANFSLTALVNIAGKYPAVKADLDLKQVDLQKLNFSPTEFRLAGKVNADIKTADPDYLNGDVSIRGLQLVKEGQKINVDTIDVHSEATATNNLLTLKSELLSARVEGKYQLTNLAAAMTNQINKYYKYGVVTKVPDQRLLFSVKIYNPKFIKDFVPALTTFSPSYMNGILDTQKDSLKINAWFPQVVYGDYKVDSTRITVDNSDNRLFYKLLVGHIQSPSIALYGTELSGIVSNNLLNIDLILRDQKLNDRYVLGGTFRSLGEDFQFKFDPNRILLDYDRWAVAPENYIQFGKSGILANQFNLSQGTQLLSINSVNATPNSPLKVEFKDFRIETLTKFAEQDSALVGGLINGTVDVNDLMGSPKFTANMTIDRLRYQKDQLGTLRVAVNNNTPNAFETNIALTGVHELRVNGFYYTNDPANALDLTLNIDKIDLKALESVSMGQIKNGSGTITGALTVKGGTAAPKVLGDVKFNQAAFTATYVNSYFRMPNETISFTPQGVDFNNFTIIDSLNKKAVITGGVLTTDYTNFKFNMNIKTETFRVMNSTAQDNDMIYGKVFLTSDIKIRGDMNQPDVNMSVKVEKDTRFFFALPADDPSVIDQEGIVQFIDADAPPFNGQKALRSDSISKAPVKGINLTAKLEVDPEAELNVVVDPANGDALKVKGDADLTAVMDPSGKISLTGRYEIKDGSYNLSVGPLGKKAFKLVSGSTIVWTGDPMSANVNLTALYEVNAAPIDLINEPENIQAKTKLPFQVYLMMKGELLKPIISFKLDLPENERGALSGQVYTKLQNVNRNESELNKQVFALLALGRFIANNPFESLAGGGGGVSTLARSSVSKILTEQLNNLASDLIQGVEINFGVNSSEDYSTGSLQQKTDLEVGLSKKLLSDRLTVTVGSSFGLEGPQPPGQSSTNIAGNVNVEYALSKDGRYRLRAYRRNQNEGVIEGQIIETGLGFALVVDYNRFREIFRKRSRRNRENQEQRPRNEKTN